MFTVTLSPDAKRLIEDRGLARNLHKPGLLIHREGPRGEVTRSSEGRAKWEVERPYPWRAQVGEFETFAESDDVFLVEGVRVWLALIPKPHERGVRVLVLEGELHVEPVNA
jgi:hypothetical protein